MSKNHLFSFLSTLKNNLQILLDPDTPQDVFIEVTATDLTKAQIVLKTGARV